MPAACAKSMTAIAAKLNIKSSRLIETMILSGTPGDRIVAQAITSGRHPSACREASRPVPALFATLSTCIPRQDRPIGGNAAGSAPRDASPGPAPRATHPIDTSPSRMQCLDPSPDPRPNPGPGARAQWLLSHRHLLRRRRGALGLLGHAGNDTECSRCCAGDTAVASCLGARRRPGAICTRQAVHPTSRARACARVRAIGADRRQALAWVGLALRPRT